ncbi:hypothetical protein L288_02510 [Sphingobium quisquiliarum P25]|uniref:Pilus assembly protein n=1 Tax=Sphingobium quisquiliarum P25 TaxID=1329909 RepID=T0IS89_9SPHN|nr:Flp family type IVb pilin [Sphingobium quisquiliarum]EQB12549.1 hypothetical protein L288_02510 [Sphingobium quisquiliarum P25]
MHELIKTISMRALIQSEYGATTVEYGLIVALIFLSMIAALQGVTDQTISMWNYVATKVSGH